MSCRSSKHHQYPPVASAMITRVALTHSSDRQPFKVRLDRVGFPLCEVCSVVAAGDGVVRVGATALPGVVGHLVVVPYKQPSVLLVQKLKIRVRSVVLVPKSVVIEGPNLPVGLGYSAAVLSIRRTKMAYISRPSP